MTIEINHPSGPGPGPDEPRWSTDELTEQFEVRGFMAPYVVVRRRSDGQLGSLQFVSNPGEPRVYFGWTEAP